MEEVKITRKLIDISDPLDSKNLASVNQEQKSVRRQGYFISQSHLNPGRSLHGKTVFSSLLFRT